VGRGHCLLKIWEQKGLSDLSNCLKARKSIAGRGGGALEDLKLDV